MNRRPLWISLILVLALSWGSAAAMLAASWEPKLGLDLQGGFSVVLAAPEGTDPEVLDQAVETMRQRIENLGRPNKFTYTFFLSQMITQITVMNN